MKPDAAELWLQENDPERAGAVRTVPAKYHRPYRRQWRDEDIDQIQRRLQNVVHLLGMARDTPKRRAEAMKVAISRLSDITRGVRARWGIR